jgi:NAD(P)H-hydrate repair Nnr-like enzyme with NAD(P)H-hydrate epimerase domain
MEILTAAEMQRADQLTIADGTPGFALILVVAGRGNNGGDGFIAAAELAARGREVTVILLCRRETLTGDAALAAAEWKGKLLPCDPASIGAPALIVDALFGTGLDRPIKGDPFEMIAAINARQWTCRAASTAPPVR